MLIVTALTSLLRHLRTMVCKEGRRE